MKRIMSGLLTGESLDDLFSEQWTDGRSLGPVFKYLHNTDTNFLLKVFQAPSTLFEKIQS